MIQCFSTEHDLVSGGMAVVEHRRAGQGALLFLILFTGCDMHQADVLVAVQAHGVVAHVEPCEGLRSLALCVDVDSKLRYIVVGPLPTSKIVDACFCDCHSESSGRLTSGPLGGLSRCPLGQRASIRLEWAQVCNVSDHLHGIATGSCGGGSVEIPVGLLRDAVLKVLPVQRPHLLEFLSGIRQDMLKWANHPKVLEVLAVPSLGLVVHFLSGPLPFVIVSVPADAVARGDVDAAHHKPVVKGVALLLCSEKLSC
ncbi:hypothetical protein DQ04_07281010 [Trypanosoma grayi]|uniref:hypothetical protein n=1 Tax=Trypanosoma grayi TaxID=71804 RepID=UPI0004F499CF|nr:hypothetical protein DQ04_07281010 [Trypanosoma grayi]KEG08396.1 hypothetical protein DQ04_07281010 [Trypanosoma grayi]